MSELEASANAVAPIWLGLVTAALLVGWIASAVRGAIDRRVDKEVTAILGEGWKQ